MNDEKSLPQVVSREALEKAVIDQAVQSPFTTFPTIIGILGVTGGLLFSQPLALLLGILAVVGGGGNGVVSYFMRYDVIARRYLDRIHHERQRRIDTEPSRLVSGFRSLEFDRGAQQIEALGMKYEEFLRVLGERFKPEELTYSQYLVTAEVVYLATLDRLQDILSRLQSVASIDRVVTRERLAELRREPGEEEEAEVFERRLAVAEGVDAEVDGLLLENEQALTALDEIAVAVARIETSRNKLSSARLDEALKELVRLAEQAKQYR